MHASSFVTAIWASLASFLTSGGGSRLAPDSDAEHRMMQRLRGTLQFRQAAGLARLTYRVSTAIRQTRQLQATITYGPKRDFAIVAAVTGFPSRRMRSTEGP